MDEQELRDLIGGLLREAMLEDEVVMRTKSYHAGKFDDTLKMVLAELFDDVGVKQIEAKSDENGGSIIRVSLNNGDTIKAVKIPFPLSGTITINGQRGKMVRPINGPQAINLVTTMRKVWDEYSGGAR